MSKLTTNYTIVKIADHLEVEYAGLVFSREQWNINTLRIFMVSSSDFVIQDEINKVRLSWALCTNIGGADIDEFIPNGKT